MRRLLFLALGIVSLYAIIGCQDKNPDDGLTPSLSVDIPGLLVPAAGCDTTFTYSLTNPKENGQLDVVSSEDWVGNFNTDTENTISLTVQPNELDERRSSILTISYTYPGGEPIVYEINLIQEAAVLYDYNFEATVFEGLYYGTDFAPTYNYYAWISSKPFDESGFFQNDAIYYLFDIYTATPPMNADNLVPPTGTYTLGLPGYADDMTFSVDYSRRAATDAEGNRLTDLYWADGTLTISQEGDNYIYEAFLEDTNGDTHHVIYRGATVYVDDTEPAGGGIIKLDQDINTTLVYAAGTYMGGNKSIMEISLQMSDMNSDGWLVPPGSRVMLDVFVPYNENGEIAAGTYTIEEGNTEIGGMVPGIMNENVEYPFPSGSYVQYYDEESNTHIGLFKSGTLTVSGDANGYEIKCDFVTVEDHTVSCTYTGTIRLYGVPGPYSCFTEDYTVNLEGAEATAYYYADYYLTGANWIIDVITDTEGLTMEIVADTLHLDVTEGIPTGTYTACQKSYFGPWEYMPGSMSNSGDLSGTNYLGEIEIEGDYRWAGKMAPATSGDLNITNNGDGSYSISFVFLDDRGHTWSGQWSGRITTYDYSNPTNAPARVSKGFSLLRPEFRQTDTPPTVSYGLKRQSDSDRSK